jgi:hypothetical protein
MRQRQKNHIFKFKVKNQRHETHLSYPTIHGKKPFSIFLTLEDMENSDPGQACSCGIAVAGMRQSALVKEQLGYEPWSWEVDKSRAYLGSKVKKNNVLSQLHSFRLSSASMEIVRTIDGKGMEAIRKLPMFKKGSEVIIDFVPTYYSKVNNVGQNTHPSTPPKNPRKRSGHGALARLRTAGLIDGIESKLTGV